jgi:hypothetical protein
MADGNIVIAFTSALFLTFLISRIAVHLLPNVRGMMIFRKIKPADINLHHAHWGSILVIISALYMIFYSVNQIVATILGIGIALALDEIVPLLLLKTTRKQELKVYNKALPHTLIVFIFVVVAIIILSFLQIV